jgi:hypothetical protein
VHRATASKRHQHKITRIVAAPHRNQFDGVDLAKIGDADDAQAASSTLILKWRAMGSIDSAAF